MIELNHTMFCTVLAVNLSVGFFVHVSWAKTKFVWWELFVISVLDKFLKKSLELRYFTLLTMHLNRLIWHENLCQVRVAVPVSCE